MQLGETIATYDVALALRGESGKFEVKSPAGETFQVTCKPNHSITNFEWSGSKAEAQPFMIRKVAEPVSPQQGATTTEAEPQVRTNQAPFLLETQGNEAKSSSNGDRVVSLPKIVEDNSSVLEAASLDLLFLERDPKTGQPSACVLVNRGAGKNEGSITAACATFNEFDAETRRLHAQLDEFRARARKMFYKSQMAASA
jgi:hypothetical protein